jgi:hypothetical protein
MSIGKLTYFDIDMTNFHISDSPTRGISTMAVGTNTTHPPILPTTPTRPSRPLKPLKPAPKPSVISAAMKGKRHTTK